MAEWISVEDRLPKWDDWVLGCFDNKTITTTTGDNIRVCGHEHKIRGFTHWMPLPEPPKEEQPMADIEDECMTREEAVRTCVRLGWEFTERNIQRIGGVEYFRRLLAKWHKRDKEINP